MSNQPRIPEPETRARHIAKLRDLNKHIDKHILDLDELNAKNHTLKKGYFPWIK